MDLLSGFSDLHRLGSEFIDKHVVGGRIGVYVLDKYQPGPFTTHFVGRSDSDVADRLKKWASDGGSSISRSSTNLQRIPRMSWNARYTTT